MHTKGTDVRNKSICIHSVNRAQVFRNLQVRQHVDNVFDDVVVLDGVQMRHTR